MTLLAETVCAQVAATAAGEALRAEAPLLAALFGLIVGSFLNVCIYRVPLGRSIVHPRSACPACGAAIAAWQNIPVVSWLLLRGRCAACRARISPRYPFVESLNAALWVAALLRFGPSVQALLLLPLLSALIVLFFTDWDHQLLPDRITLPLAAVGLAVSPFNARLDFGPGLIGSGTPAGRIAAALAGAAVGFGLFYAIAKSWELLFKRDAMGGGDLKLMLGVGAFLGVGGVGVTVFLGSITGTLISLPFLLRGSWTLRRELPFGCFLTPAAAVAAFCGVELIRWYLGLLMLPGS